VRQWQKAALQKVNCVGIYSKRSLEFTKGQSPYDSPATIVTVGYHIMSKRDYVWWRGSGVDRWAASEIQTMGWSHGWTPRTKEASHRCLSISA